MGNTLDEAKAIADEVTLSSNNEDDLKHILLKYFG